MIVQYEIIGLPYSQEISRAEVEVRTLEGEKFSLPLAMVLGCLDERAKEVEARAKEQEKPLMAYRFFLVKKVVKTNPSAQEWITQELAKSIQGLEGISFLVKDEKLLAKL